MNTGFCRLFSATSLSASYVPFGIFSIYFADNPMLLIRLAEAIFSIALGSSALCPLSHHSNLGALATVSFFFVIAFVLTALGALGGLGGLSTLAFGGCFLRYASNLLVLLSAADIGAFRPFFT